MEKFQVSITETLTKTIEVDANDEIEALVYARFQWDNEDVVLDSSNFINVDFDIVD